MKPKITLEAIIQAARQLFWRKGFARTQMADIAKEMGIAVGTLYLYVKSKEALFDLVLRHGIESSLPLESLELPLQDADLNQTRQFIEQTLMEHAHWPLLQAAIAARKPPAALATEWRAMLAEIYALLERHCWGLRMVNSSAHDFPWLAEIFLLRFRQGLLTDLARFFTQRAADGLDEAKAQALAYFVVENIASAVLHRQGDPVYTHFPAPLLRETLLNLLEHAIVAELQPGRGPKPARVKR